MAENIEYELSDVETSCLRIYRGFTKEGVRYRILSRLAQAAE